MNINRTTILLLAMLLGLTSLAFSQGDVTSPYSFIGLGDNYTKGNIKSLSMGGVDMALRNPMYINMVNPAGLSGIDSMSFVGSVGINMNNSTYRTSSVSSKFSSANVNHLAVAFPVTKWWKTAILLLPYSTVGYEVSDDDITENGVKTSFYYDGNGGMDAVSWVNAFSLTKNLAFGINASYYFGNLEHTRKVTFPDSVFIFNSMVKEKVLLSGLFFEAGLQYFYSLDDKNTLGFGLKYGNKSSLNARSDYVAFSYLGEELYNNSTLDTIRSWTEAKTTIELPFSVGVGISWVKTNKLSLAADFKFEKWSDFKYFNTDLEYTNKIRASIGGEYIPESNNLSSYWKMMHYRMGFRYENLGMKFANNELREYAISIGFGLPLRKSKTMVNLGFELGQNGTIKDDLIQERYVRVMLGVSIKETWFRKSKYY